MKLSDWIWLWWHGYCRKHLQAIPQHPEFTFQCPECEKESEAKHIERFENIKMEIERERK